MRKALLASCLAAALLGSGSLPAQQEANEAELAQLQESIRKAQVELANTRSQRSAALASLQASEAAIVAVQQSLRGLQSEVDGLQSELATLDTQASGLEESRRAQLQQLGSHLQAAHTLSQGQQLKLLLNQDDPVKASRMLQYYRYVSAARSTRIRDFRATLDTLGAVRAEIAASSATLETRQQSLQAEEAELATQQDKRLALLDELDIELSEQGAGLASLEQRQQEIELLLEELRSAISELNLGDAGIPFAERKGELPWPVEAKPGNRFGAQRGQGDLSWEGVMLPAAAGTPVRAIHHGRVVFADWLGNSGLLLIIDHGDGFMSLYAHNQQHYKTVGEWVSGGDQIAAVGNTGGQRNSGLYFEIRRNGKAENPVNWCVAQR